MPTNASKQSAVDVTVRVGTLTPEKFHLDPGQQAKIVLDTFGQPKKDNTAEAVAKSGDGPQKHKATDFDYDPSASLSDPKNAQASWYKRMLPQDVRDILNKRPNNSGFADHAGSLTDIQPVDTKSAEHWARSKNLEQNQKTDAGGGLRASEVIANRQGETGRNQDKRSTHNAKESGANSNNSDKSDPKEKRVGQPTGSGHFTEGDEERAVKSIVDASLHGMEKSVAAFNAALDQGIPLNTLVDDVNKGLKEGFPKRPDVGASLSGDKKHVIVGLPIGGFDLDVTEKDGKQEVQPGEIAR